MKIGIIGATGAVGRQMLECLEERHIEAEEIRLFASARSAGKKIQFNGTELTVQEISHDGFEGLDYVLGAVSNALSKEYAPSIVKAGAVYIDNSSAFRLDKDIPLVVPQINGADALNHHGIIANPNCSTIITMMAVAPIARISPITTLYATTFQAVSGVGVGGIAELDEQIDAIYNHKEVETKAFRKQIAYNCLAEIGSYTDNGYTTEEMKMQNEGRKILHLPDMKVTCTCVRVPVYRSHSISVSCITEKPVGIKEAIDAINAFPDVQYIENDIPTPLETSDQDVVYVGRMRKDLCNDNGLALWCCGDQIRKGAATNAVEIMEYLIAHK